MTPVEILTKSRALIEKPENWTQGELARDNSGYSVPTDSNTAVCFCLYGAMKRVAPNNFNYNVFKPLHDAIDEIRFGVDIATFNDSTDHPTVLRMFDLAIEKAKSAESQP